MSFPTSADPTTAVLQDRIRWKDRLRQSIGELLGRFKETETYRDLVRLGLDYLSTTGNQGEEARQEAAGAFRELLVQRGLSGPRASEVTTILSQVNVAEDFTATTKKPISLRRAIRDARKAIKADKKKNEPKLPGDKVKRSAAATNLASRRLKRIRRDADKLLAEVGDKKATWPINCGVYRLDFSANSVVAKP